VQHRAQGQLPLVLAVIKLVMRATMAAFMTGKGYQNLIQHTTAVLVLS
jgi:hypothetical protein